MSTSFVMCVSRDIQVSRQYTKYWIPENLWCFWHWSIPNSSTVPME